MTSDPLRGRSAKATGRASDPLPLFARQSVRREIADSHDPTPSIDRCELLTWNIQTN